MNCATTTARAATSSWQVVFSLALIIWLSSVSCWLFLCRGCCCFSSVVFLVVIAFLFSFRPIFFFSLRTKHSNCFCVLLFFCISLALALCATKKKFFFSSTWYTNVRTKWMFYLMIFAKLNYCFVDISGCVEHISCSLSHSLSHCQVQASTFFLFTCLTKAKRCFLNEKYLLFLTWFKCEKILSDSLNSLAQNIYEILCTCCLFFFSYNRTDKTKSISWINKLLITVLHSFRLKLVQN